MTLCYVIVDAEAMLTSFTGGNGEFDERRNDQKERWEQILADFWRKDLDIPAGRKGDQVPISHILDKFEKDERHIRFSR